MNEYPQPRRREERDEWRAYWKGLLNHGQYWPNHPPPSNYPRMKGYEAWVNAFRPCVGAECGMKVEQDMPGREGSMLQRKKDKKALHVDEKGGRKRGETQSRTLCTPSLSCSNSRLQSTWTKNILNHSAMNRRDKDHVGLYAMVKHP